MEFTVTSATLSIALVAVATFIWKVVNWAYLRPKQLERCLRQQGFRLNPYRLVYGDVKEMISMTREAKSKPMDASSNDIIPYLQPYHRHLAKLYGDNYCIWLGPVPRVVISDPKLVKEVLFNYEAFQKVQRSPLIKVIVTGLLRYEGRKWAMHRDLLSPAFSLEKLKHMVPAMRSSCRDLVSKWDKLLSPKGSCELDVWPFLCSLAADVISRTAFGSNYEEGKRIFELLREQIHITVPLLRSFYIPGSRFLPTKTNKRLKKIHDEFGALLGNIIDNKAQALKAGVGNNDLLGILLKTISGETQEQGKRSNIKMSLKEVIEECKLFYLAGQETTSVLLVWTMILLSKHQKWQTLAREEVFTVFADNEPDFNGLNQLKIVTMILYEVLRLYTPAMVSTRRTNERVKLGENVLPAGVEIELSFISIHHNPDIWGEDAKEFKPERFSEGITKAASIQGAFFAFSGGPRICIGQNFAMIEAKIVLAMILRCFSFKLSPSYRHAPSFLLTIEPQHGAHLIFQKI